MGKRVIKTLFILLVNAMITGIFGFINPFSGSLAFADAGKPTPVAEPDYWNVPDKWYMDAQSGVVELDTSEKHSGERSVKLTGTGLVGQSLVLDRPWVELTAPTEYTISVWYKTAGGYNGTPRISVQYLNKWGTPFINENGEYISYFYGETGDHDWQLWSVTVVMPAGSAKPQVQFETEGTKGAIWFDDVSITAKGSTKNVVLNPGFETLYAQMSDAEFFAKMNLDLPGMEGVKAAVQAGDYNRARAEYLNYYRTRTLPVFGSPKDGEMPEPVVGYDTSLADIAMDHFWNLIYGYDNEYFLGEDISWPAFPPSQDQSWNV